MTDINSIIKTNNILDIHEQCKTLLEENNNVLLFLDIDDTVLSSQIGVKFVDKNVTTLIELMYRQNPNKLFFLTARDPDFKRKTLNQLNSAKLVHDGKFIHYNIIHSVYVMKNGSPIATKGETLVNLLSSTNVLLLSEQPTWIIFVDDAKEQIESVYNSLNNAKGLNINYILYHYN
jgi:hypothetical protein